MVVIKIWLYTRIGAHTISHYSQEMFLILYEIQYILGTGLNCTMTKLHECTKLHEGTKLHQGTKLHEGDFAPRVNFARE